MRPLLITVVCAAVVVAAAEWSASRVHGGNQDADAAPPSVRAANVVVLPKRVENTPPPVATSSAARSVLLIGNSHTYALPSLVPGGDLRPDPGATLIDELAKRIEARPAARPGARPLTHYRLSYPNFLPLEVLTRLGQLRDLGYQPEVVLMGIAWSNMGRGSSVRASIRKLYQDPEFTARRLAELERVGADGRLLEAVRVNRRREERVVDEQRMQSAADRVDEHLNERAGEHVSLLGQSSAIRARFYRDFAYGIDLLIHESGSGQSNDVVSEDLALNLQAVAAIGALLAEQGAKLIVYQNPERGDLPPLVDVSQRDASMAWLRGELEERGFLLLDASKVVPDAMFGWEHDTPDRSHFTEPGHALLAGFLVDAAAERGLLDTIVAAR